MIFESTSDAARVSSIPFAKNAFIVIAEADRGRIDDSVRDLTQVLKGQRFPVIPDSPRGFRVMAHIDGELSSVDPAAKQGLERLVSASTGGRVEARGMCQEYWVIGRLDMGEVLFCARLPKVARPKKARGAVSYELSSMFVMASGPSPQDVYLDPFAGSGSFVTARLEAPAREIIYSDADLNSHRDGFPGEMIDDRRVRLLSEDALKLPSIPDGAVDVIVTDPPWGEHEEVPMPYPEFVSAVSDSFNRVLNPETGRFVLLCARRSSQIFRESLEGVSFAIDAAHEILVNGHPATVLVGRRGAGEPAGTDAKGVGRRAPHSPQKPLLVGMSTYRRAVGRFSQ